MKERGKLYKGPPGRLIVGYVRRPLPVVLVEIVETLPLLFQKKSELDVIVDILAVLLHGFYQMHHLEEAAGSLLPGHGHVKRSSLIPGKDAGIFPGGGEKKEVAGIFLHDPPE